ncbi:MAG: GNAT family N-acetyltransferase [Proteobacteria bacterium]|nr:GNAT family N-acetyltransferase [Pseudomonadota bacterium]
MNIIDLRENAEAIPLLSEWHHHEWSYQNPQFGLEERIEKMRCHLCEDFIPSTYVAEEAAEILGSATVLKHDMEIHLEYSPWLASVFVSQDHRNKGVGSELVLHVMAQAKKNNISNLYLFTPDKELFYNRLGWQTIHKELYKNIEVTIMRIQLQN